MLKNAHITNIYTKEHAVVTLFRRKVSICKYLFFFYLKMNIYTQQYVHDIVLLRVSQSQNKAFMLLVSGFVMLVVTNSQLCKKSKFKTKSKGQDNLVNAPISDVYIFYLDFHVRQCNGFLKVISYVLQHYTNINKSCLLNK